MNKTEISAEEKRLLDAVDRHFAQPLMGALLVIVSALGKSEKGIADLALRLRSEIDNCHSDAIGRKYLDVLADRAHWDQIGSQ